MLLACILIWKCKFFLGRIIFSIVPLYALDKDAVTMTCSMDTSNNLFVISQSPETTTETWCTRCRKDGQEWVGTPCTGLVTTVCTVQGKIMTSVTTIMKVDVTRDTGKWYCFVTNGNLATGELGKFGGYL